MYGAGAAKALLGLSLPLAARAQLAHDSLEHLSCRFGWPPRARLAHVFLVRGALTHRDQRLDAPPEIISHHPRFDPLACRHTSAPTPCKLRLKTRVSNLRITSWSCMQGLQPMRLAEPLTTLAVFDGFNSSLNFLRSRERDPNLPPLAACSRDSAEAHRESHAKRIRVNPRFFQVV